MGGDDEFSPEKVKFANSLVVQWLGLHTSTAGWSGSIPGSGTKILQTSWPKKKKKKVKFDVPAGHPSGDPEANVFS